MDHSPPSASIPRTVSSPSWFGSSALAWVCLGVFALLQAGAVTAVGLDFAAQALLVLCLLLVGSQILARPFVGLLAIALVTLSVHSSFTEGHRVRFLGFSWYLMDWPLVLMAAGALVRWSAGGRYRRRYLRLPLPLVLLIAYAVFAAVLGLVRGNQPRMVFYDLRPFVYYLTFVFVLVLVDSRRKLRLLVTSWILFSIVGSLWGIALAVSMAPTLAYQAMGFFRIAGPSEPTYGLMLVFSLSLFPFVRGRLRILLLVQLLLSATALAFGYTRGSWLGTGVAAALLIGVLARRSPRRLVPLAWVGGATLVALVPVLFVLGMNPLDFVTSRVQAGLRWSADLAILCRLVEYRVVWAAWQEHPVLGTGLGHLFTFVQPLLGRGHWVYTHGSYLYVLSKMGIVGLVLFLTMLATFLVRGLRTFRRAEDGFLKGVSLGCVTALVFLMVKCFSTWSLNHFLLTMLVGLILGVLQWISVEVAGSPRDGAAPDPDPGPQPASGGT